MTSSLSAIQTPPKRTRMRRRNGSAYKSRLGSSSATRNRPIAPGESGPCCHDNPIDHLTTLSCSHRGVRESARLVHCLARPNIAAPHSPVSPTPHPAGDGPPDLVWRIFLDEMEPRNR